MLGAATLLFVHDVLRDRYYRDPLQKQPDGEDAAGQDEEEGKAGQKRKPLNAEELLKEAEEQANINEVRVGRVWRGGGAAFDPAVRMQCAL